MRIISNDSEFYWPNLCLSLGIFLIYVGYRFHSLYRPTEVVLLDPGARQPLHVVRDE